MPVATPSHPPSPLRYVEQMDVHSPAQSVLEALQFSARLRLPGDTSRDKVGQVWGPTVRMCGICQA